MTTILIEDDFNWRIKFQIALDELGVTILGVAENIDNAMDLLNKHKPSFILTDILLNNEVVFDLFKNCPRFCNIPTIFVTVSDKEIYYKESSIIDNSLYLVKPIHKLTLKSAINRLCGSIKIDDTKQKIKNLRIKGTYNQKIDLPFDKIIYIRQNQHYCFIHTLNQQFTIKKSLVKVMKELDNTFLQIHRSHCINVNFIENFGIGLETIKLKNIDLPIGLTFKEIVKQLIAENYSVKQ